MSIRLLSLQRQNVQLGQDAQPVIFPAWIVVEAVDAGVHLMQGLDAGTTFVRTDRPPHYIFDGKTFTRVLYDQEKTDKIDKINKEMKEGDILCKYGCGNIAMYPPAKPVRCCEHHQQCPAQKDKLQKTMTKKLPVIEDGHTGKPLPAEKMEMIPKKKDKVPTVKAPTPPRDVEPTKVESGPAVGSEVAQQYDNLGEMASKHINAEPPKKQIAPEKKAEESAVTFDFGKSAKDLNDALNRSGGAEGIPVTSEEKD